MSNEKYPGLAERVSALRVNPDAIEKIRVEGSMPGVIPNADGKRMSLQVYAAITTNDSHITSEGAEKGLEVFGEELREESRASPGKHPNIERLEEIARNGNKVRSYMISRESAKPIPPRVLDAIYHCLKVIPTPFHIYDGTGIRETAQRMNAAFSWVPGGFKNFYAIKANPNPAIAALLREWGFGSDCSSESELDISEDAGITGENIICSSNNTPPSLFVAAKKKGAIINIDDITFISTLEHFAGIPEVACFRFNPGNERTGNAIIGDPVEAKYGLTREQMFEAYAIMKAKGSKRFGMHTMVASNELNEQYFVETARMIFGLVGEISSKVGIRFEFVDLGGGVGTPYRPEQMPVDIEAVSRGIKKLYDDMIVAQGLGPLRVTMECGRYVTGPHGFLVSKALNIMKKHKDFVGLDGCMSSLMRPGIYGAYHHVTILGKEDAQKDYVCDVVGGLCENNDKFAINRPLPIPSKSDIFVVHNTGAHGRAMCFNYNGQLRCGEVLIDKGDIQLIRRHETKADYRATEVFPPRNIVLPL